MNSIQSSVFLLHVILVFSLGLKPSCHRPVIKAYLPTDNLALFVLALVVATNLYLISAIEYMLVAMELGFPFPKLLHNFCRTKRNIFLSLCISFARKNNNLRNHSQKSFRKKLPYSAFAKLKFRTIPQLEFSANYAKKMHITKILVHAQLSQ